MKKIKISYVSPKVTVTKCMVEDGFALSHTSEPVTETILGTEEIGQASGSAFFD